MITAIEKLKHGQVLFLFVVRNAQQNATGFSISEGEIKLEEMKEKNCCSRLLVNPNVGGHRRDICVTKQNELSNLKINRKEEKSHFRIQQIIAALSASCHVASLRLSPFYTHTRNVFVSHPQHYHFRSHSLLFFLYQFHLGTNLLR